MGAVSKTSRADHPTAESRLAGLPDFGGFLNGAKKALHNADQAVHHAVHEAKKAVHEVDKAVHHAEHEVKKAIHEVEGRAGGVVHRTKRAAHRAPGAPCRGPGRESCRGRAPRGGPRFAGR
jgi:hypothetical protein